MARLQQTEVECEYQDCEFVGHGQDADFERLVAAGEAHEVKNPGHITFVYFHDHTGV